MNKDIYGKYIEKKNIVRLMGIWLLVCIFLVPSALKIEFNYASVNHDYNMVIEGYEDDDLIFAYTMDQDYIGNHYILLNLREVLKTRTYVMGVRIESEITKINLELNDIQVTIGNIPLLNITSNNWNKLAVFEWEAFFECSDKTITLSSKEPEYATFGFDNLRALLKWPLACFMIGYVLLCVLIFFTLYKKQQALAEMLRKLFSICKNVVHWLYPYVLACVIGTITAGSITKIIDVIGLQTYMEKGELAVWIIAIFVAACFIRSRCENVTEQIVLVLCVGICLFFSVCKVTNYCTVDEGRAIYEQFHLQTDPLRHWLMTESRSSYLLMGTFWTFAPSAFICNWLGVLSIQLAQLMFWLLGFCVVQLIIYWVYNLFAKCVSKDFMPVMLAGVYIVTLNIPLLNMALKNYTYDMFSMMFGILGIAQLVNFVIEHKKTYGILSVISLVLSVQEKIICAPVLMISIFVYAFILSKGNRKDFGRNAVYAVLITWTVSFFTHWWVLDVLRLGNYPPMKAEEIVGTVFAAMGMVLSKTDISFLQSNVVILSIIILLLLFAGREFICAFQTIYTKHEVAINSGINYAVFGWICIGIAVNFIEIPDSFGIIVKWMFEYPARIVNALPTIVLAGILLEILWIRNSICSFLLLYCTYANTILYMIDLKHTWIKYSNIYVGIICLCGCYGLIQAGNFLWGTMYRKKQICIVAALMVVLTVSETMTSMPAYTYFAPYWNFSIYCKKPINYGWGEYISVAGEKIAKYCDQNGIDIKKSVLFRGYHGSWNNSLFKKYNNVENVLGKGAFLIKNNDFILIDNYVLNIKKYVSESDLNGIEPIDVIKYRGIIMLRIYKGEQLRELLKEKEAVDME